MKILLIFAKSIISDKIILPPLGLTYIASLLKTKENCEIKIIDERVDDADIISEAKVFDVVGFSTHILNFKRSLILANLIKEVNPKCKIIFGGPWVSCKETIESKNVDYVITGEGEFSFLNLIKNIKSRKYPKNKVIKSEVIENLDKLPFPDYSFYKNFSSYTSNEGVKPHVMILTSRGCPFNCSFCTKKVFGYKIRTRSPQNVVDEIKYLIENFGVKGIDIADDNFSFDQKRAIKICDLLIKETLGVIVNCTNGLRIETINKNLLKKMKKANFHRISIGIESGDKRILKNLNKYIDLRKAIKVVKWCRELGIIVQAFFMLGLPGDNEKSMRKTLEFAKKLNPHYAYFHMALPFPGTRLYEEILKNGNFLVDIKNGLNKGYFSTCPFFALPGMNPKIINYYAKISYIEFYLRPKKILDILLSIKNLNQLIWLTKSLISIISINL